MNTKSKIEVKEFFNSFELSKIIFNADISDNALKDDEITVFLKNQIELISLIIEYDDCAGDFEEFKNKLLLDTKLNTFFQDCADDIIENLDKEYKSENWPRGVDTNSRLITPLKYRNKLQNSRFNTESQSTNKFLFFKLKNLVDKQLIEKYFNENLIDYLGTNKHNKIKNLYFLNIDLSKKIE